MIWNLMSLNRNYQVRILMKKHSKLNKDKKSFLNTSKGDLSKDRLDIQDKPDVSVWNKEVRIQGKDKGKAKIGSLNQNLIREDTNVSIDPANKESIDDAIVSGTH
jgi:hypothetical protein